MGGLLLRLDSLSSTVLLLSLLLSLARFREDAKGKERSNCLRGDGEGLDAAAADAAVLLMVDAPSAAADGEGMFVCRVAANAL